MLAVQTQVRIEKSTSVLGAMNCGGSASSVRLSTAAWTTPPIAPIRANRAIATSPPRGVGGRRSARLRMMSSTMPCAIQAATCAMLMARIQPASSGPSVATGAPASPKSNGTIQGIRPNPCRPGSRLSAVRARKSTRRWFTKLRRSGGCRRWRPARARWSSGRGHRSAGR